MAFTGHGHQIVGSPVSGIPPAQRSRCGGEGVCEPCTEDASQWRITNIKEPVEAGTQALIRMADTIEEIARSLALLIEHLEPKEEVRSKRPLPFEHKHKALQFSDGREPWCPTCGLTETGNVPRMNQEENNG